MNLSPLTSYKQINAGIVRDLATGIAKFCPKAFVLVISNPVNSTVPIVAEVLKQHGVFDSKRCVFIRDTVTYFHYIDRLFGVTTLDVVRASTFVAELIGDLSQAPAISIPVVGGHSGITVSTLANSKPQEWKFILICIWIWQIVPLFSQSSHPLPANLQKSDLEKLTKRVQFGGDEVVEAKAGTGSATLSMAYAGAEFAEKILRAIKGEKGIVAPSYVNLAAEEGGKAVQGEIGDSLEYFSARVQLGVCIISYTLT